MRIKDNLICGTIVAIQVWLLIATFCSAGLLLFGEYLSNEYSKNRGHKTP